MEDCGLKTNIWDRLRLIQRLKKDFASAKVGKLNLHLLYCELVKLILILLCCGLLGLIVIFL